MTTLRDQIAAKLHATWDLDEHDVETFVAELLAMWRDEAPPSDAVPPGYEYEKLGKAMRGMGFPYWADRCEKLVAERAELQRLLECAQKRIGELHDALKAKVLKLPIKQMRQAERERDAAREELREVGEAILRDGTALTIYPQTNGRVALNDVTHGTRTMPWDGTPAGIIAALLAARKAGAGK